MIKRPFVQYEPWMETIFIEDIKITMIQVARLSSTDNEMTMKPTYAMSSNSIISHFILVIFAFASAATKFNLCHVSTSFLHLPANLFGQTKPMCPNRFSATKMEKVRKMKTVIIGPTDNARYFNNEFWFQWHFREFFLSRSLFSVPLEYNWHVKFDRKSLFWFFLTFHSILDIQVNFHLKWQINWICSSLSSATRRASPIPISFDLWDTMTTEP